MVRRYDFDIRWLEGPGIRGAVIADGTVRPEPHRHYVALFRDPETVQALASASEPVRAFFRQSGFGLDVSGGDLADGHYSAEDEAAHFEIVMRLADNLLTHRLTGENLNGFDFAAFLDHVMKARPVPMDALQAASGPDVRSGKLAEVAVMMVFTVLIALFAGGILKVVGMVTAMATTIS